MATGLAHAVTFNGAVTLAEGVNPQSLGLDGDGTAYMSSANGTSLFTLKRGAHRARGPLALVRGERRPRAAAVGVANNGEIVAVYQRARAQKRQRPTIRVVFRSRTGVVSMPRTISTPAVAACCASLAVNPRGEAVAAWLEHSGPRTFRVEVATRAAGRAFTQPHAVGELAFARPLTVVINATGAGLVTWFGTGGSGPMVAEVAIGRIASPAHRLEPPTGARLVPEDLAGDDRNRMAAAVGKNGTAAAAWARRAGDRTLVLAAVASPTGRFGEPVRLSDTIGPATGWDVGVDPSGDVSATWAAYDGDLDSSAARAPVHLSDMPAGGAFGNPLMVSTVQDKVNEVEAFEPSPTLDLAINDSGAALVAWSSVAPPSGFHGRAKLAIRHPDGTFSHPIRLLDHRPADVVHVAANAAGDVALAFTKFGGGGALIDRGARTLLLTGRA